MVDHHREHEPERVERPWLLRKVTSTEENTGHLVREVDWSESTRSLFAVTPPVRGPNIILVVISPGPSHSFGLFMVWHYVVVISEFLLADRAFTSLLDNLPIQELSHLCG